MGLEPVDGRSHQARDDGGALDYFGDQGGGGILPLSPRIRAHVGSTDASTWDFFGDQFGDGGFLQAEPGKRARLGATDARISALVGERADGGGLLPVASLMLTREGHADAIQAFVDAMRTMALGWLGVLMFMVIDGPGGGVDDADLTCRVVVEASCGVAEGVSKTFMIPILLGSAFRVCVWTNAMNTEVVVRYRVRLPWCAIRVVKAAYGQINMSQLYSYTGGVFHSGV